MTATAPDTAGRRHTVLPPSLDTTSTIEMTRQTASSPTRTTIVRAVPGVSIRMTSVSGPCRSQLARTRVTTRMGAANKRPVRRAPAYHWPAPGQTNDRNAAIPGERTRRPPRGSMLTAGGSLTRSQRPSVVPAEALRDHRTAADWRLRTGKSKEVAAGAVQAKAPSST